MSKVDPRSVAQALMRKAQKDISPKNRGRQHGDLAASFDMIADFWNVYLRHKARAAGIDVANVLVVNIDAVDVLEMMAMLKKARNVYGDPLADHAADDIGYTGLAGGLRLAGAVGGKIQEEVEALLRSGQEVAPPEEKPEEDETTPEEKPEEDETTPIPAFLRSGKTTMAMGEGSVE